MTPSLLRQWSFQNSQPDQWWLSLDAVTEEVPVTVAEIEERLKSGDYSAVQALHVSQAGMENAPWVEVAMPPAMKAPPIMQPPVAAIAPAPLPASHSAASIATSEHSKPDETLGIIILLIPVMGAFLIWYSPVVLLLPLSALTVASTAILVGIEANKLGVGKDKKFDKKGREKKESGPIGWAVLLLAFWIVGFPYYLYWRSRYGAKNMLVGGICGALVFLGSIILVPAVIQNNVTRTTEKFRQEFEANANMHETNQQVTTSLEERAISSLHEIEMQVARDAEKQYDIALRAGSPMDVYTQASLVAAAYLQANDEEKYREWKQTEEKWAKLLKLRN